MVRGQHLWVTRPQQPSNIIKSGVGSGQPAIDSDGGITGIRSWIGAINSSAVIVMMAQVPELP